MTEHTMQANQVYRTLHSISDAMPVYDVEGKKVGKVRFVYFGDNYELSQVARPDDFYRLPPEIQTQLASEGFVQVDCGFFARDCVVMPEEIASVTDREIRLNAPRDNLYRI